MDQKRYEIRSYGWINGKPYNMALKKTDNLVEALSYTDNPAIYILDNLDEKVIYEGGIMTQIKQIV